MTHKNDGTTRRGFLGSLGAAAALPLFPALATHAAPSGAWADKVATLGEALRVAYFAEVARFTETLRPRFESGELHAYRENDDMEHAREARAGRREGWYETPSFQIEELAVAHFGLEITARPTGDGGTWYLGNDTAAHMILSASPRADVTGEGECHVCDHAKEAVSWDVIVYARERGWYTPTADEETDPLDTMREEIGGPGRSV